MKARQRVLSTCLAGAIAFGLVPWAAAVAPANATPNHSLSLGQTVNLEAEQAQLAGGKILTNGTSYSGTGYVGDFYEGSQASFPIHVSESGDYQVLVRTGTIQDGGAAQILLNDTPMAELTIPNSGDWQTYTYTRALVTLEEGDHTLTVSNTGATWNLDCLVLTGAESYISKEHAHRYEAEAYVDQQGAKILESPSASAGRYIGDFDAGDRVEFGVYATQSGLYRFCAGVSTIQDGGSYRLEVDGTSYDMTFPTTEDWQNYILAGTAVELEPGYHHVVIHNQKNTWNLDYLEVSPLEHTGSYTVSADTPVTIPATQWEQGAGIVNEPNNVGNVDDGDWFDYPLSVQDAGVYEITLRVACGNDVGAERGVRIVTQQTGASVVSVPVTGGWQTYQEVSTKVRLVAGQQRLTFMADYEGWNLADFTLTYLSPMSNIAWDGVGFDQSGSSQAAYINDGITDDNQAVWTPAEGNRFVGVRFDRSYQVHKAVLFGDGITGTLVCSDGSIIPDVTPTPQGTEVSLGENSQIYWARFEPTENQGSVWEMELHGEFGASEVTDCALQAYASTKDGFQPMDQLLGGFTTASAKLQLNFDQAMEFQSIFLYGLPASLGETLNATLTFSDGSTQTISAPISQDQLRRAEWTFEQPIRSEFITFSAEGVDAWSVDAVVIPGSQATSTATQYTGVQIQCRWNENSDKVFAILEDGTLGYVSSNGMSEADKEATAFDVIPMAGGDTYHIRHVQSGGYLLLDQGDSRVVCGTSQDAQKPEAAWVITHVSGTSAVSITNATDSSTTLHMENETGRVEISGAQSHWHSANWILTPAQRWYTISANRVDDTGYRAISNDGTSITTNYGGVDQTWTLKQDISSKPIFDAPNMPIIEAVYNRTMEETFENTFDGKYGPVFNTGTNWNYVWTRDTAMSVQYSLAWIYPQESKNCALEKLVGTDTDHPVYQQDTGTGGSYPVSVDRIITALSIWEQYLTTGDVELLEEFYPYTQHTIQQDLHVAYDPETGLFKGETGGLDHRDKTYPDWMSEHAQDSLANIAESKSSIVNIIYCQVYEIMARSADILGYGDDVVSMWQQRKEDLVQRVNEHFWDEERGLYVSWEYPNYMGAPDAYKYDVISNGYAVMYGIANQEQCQAIMENYPLVLYGADTVYPQKNGRQAGTIYHNRGVWPGWEATLMIGAGQEGNNQLAEEIWKSCLRGCAMTLTNYEVINFATGEGVASRNQLWSIAGTLSGYYRILFGMEYTEQGIVFRPYVPERMDGPFHLTNYPYRDATLDITLRGSGDTLTSVKLDGVEMGTDYVLPTTLTGEHTLELVVEDSGVRSPINLSDYNYVACPDMPVMTYENGVFTWEEDSRYTYKLWNGQEYIPVSGGSYTPDTTRYGVYSLVAVAADGIESELSQPITIRPEGSTVLVEAEDGVYQENLFYTGTEGFSGQGAVISNANLDSTHDLVVEMEVAQAGTYSLSVCYSNRGDAPSGDYCAIRSVYVDGEDVGTLLFPVMYFDWTRSTHLTLNLDAGVHTIRIVAEDTANWYDTNINKLQHKNNQTIYLDYLQLDRMDDSNTPAQADKSLLEYAYHYALEQDTSNLIPTVAEKFQAAMDNAKAVLDKESATQAEVDAAFDQLVKAIHMLGFTKGDKTMLELLIARADGMVENADKYVTDTWQQLVDALAEAKDMLADENAMDSDIQPVVDTLLNAILAQRFKADKSILDDLVNQAEDLNLEGYTAESVAAFRSALAQAQAVLADDTLTEDDQNTVDAAVDALNTAMDGLTAEGEGEAQPSDKPETTDKPEASQKPEATQKPENVPQTGDSASLLSWAAALALSGTAALWVVRRKERS